MSDHEHAGTHDIRVNYRASSPELITLTGWHRDGEYKRKADYKFRMDGATAVLTHINSEDAGYQVRLADDERDAVREAVTDLPFVQAVVMVGGDGA